MPMSCVDNVTFRNSRLECTKDFYKDRKTDDYILSNFSFIDVEATAPVESFDTSHIDGIKIDNVEITLVPKK